SSRRRHTRLQGAGVQTCALPICDVNTALQGLTGGDSGMRMRRFYWLILGIMGGVLASVAIGQQLRRACSSFTALEPVIEYPSRQIGRASCRERVWIAMGDVSLNK